MKVSAYNNGVADAVKGLECDSAQFKTWYARTEYLSGYVNGQALVYKYKIKLKEEDSV